MKFEMQNAKFQNDGMVFEAARFGHSFVILIFYFEF